MSGNAPTSSPESVHRSQRLRNPFCQLWLRSRSCATSVRLLGGVLSPWWSAFAIERPTGIRMAQFRARRGGDEDVEPQRVGST